MARRNGRELGNANGRQLEHALVALANGATLMRLDRANGQSQTILAHVGMFNLGIVYMGETDGQWMIGYADLKTAQWFHPFQGGWLREEVKANA